MIRFNIFEPCIVFIHILTFTCSPIDKERYWREKMERDSSQSSINPNRHTKSTWRTLLEPIELIRLIKRHHMCGNPFIIFLVSNILFQIHITIKCAVHALITGSDPIKMKYFNSIYYPHLLGAFPKPYLFNNLFLAMCSLFLGARLIAAHRLIKGSIVNADRYEDIKISSIDLAYLTKFYHTIDEWRTFISKPYEHLRLVERHGENFQAHFDFGTSGIVQTRSLEMSSNWDKKFSLNMVDFNECYRWLETTLPCKSTYDNWLNAQPTHRVPSTWILILALLSMSGMILIIIGQSTLFLGIVYLELRSSIGWFNEEPTFTQVLSRYYVHLSEPLHILRILELFLYSLFVVPHNFDAAMLYIDTFHLSARGFKLARIIENEHSPSIYLSRETSKHFEQTQPTFFFGQSFNSDSTRSNQRLEYSIRILKVLYSEFLDLKSVHTPYINFVVIETSLCMSYIISLLLAIRSGAEYAVLAMLFTTCLVPFIGVLGSCAAIELMVS